MHFISSDKCYLWDTLIMAKLNFTEAFAKYGATLANPQWAVSAIANDGSLVMSCWEHYIKKHGDCLRYEDTLSRWSGNAAGNNLLRTHLTQAFNEKLPVRLLIASTTETDAVDYGHDASKVKKKFHIRPEIIGEIVSFDGDSFVIDFRKKQWKS